MFRPENIPQELKDRRQWVCWSYSQKSNGEETKVPRNPHSGGRASSTDRTTWGSFSGALDALAVYSFDGVGFVFTDQDPYVGIDLDDCYDPGAETQYPSFAIREPEFNWVRLLDSYTEISPSGKGIKIIVQGGIERGHSFGEGNGVFGSGRFFTITGQILDAHHSKIRPAQAALDKLLEEWVPVKDRREWDAGQERFTDEEVVALALSASNGHKFSVLWEGADWRVYYASQSEADAGLVAMLAFYTGPCPGQLDRLFRKSGLMRDKWDETRGEGTYGERTIQNMLDLTTEYYDPAPADEIPPTRSLTPRWREMLEQYAPLSNNERPVWLRALTSHVKPVAQQFPGEWLDMMALAFWSTQFPGTKFENLSLNLWFTGISLQGTGKSVTGDEYDTLMKRLAEERGLQVLSYTSGSAAGLLRRIAGNNMVVCSWLSEFMGLMKSMGNDYMSNMRETMMDLYDGRRVVHQLANETIIAKDPFLAVIGVTTPSSFAKAADVADAGNGFYSRFMFCCPDVVDTTERGRIRDLDRAVLVEDLQKHLEPLSNLRSVTFNHASIPPPLADYMASLGMGTNSTLSLDEALTGVGDEGLPSGRLVARVKKVAALLETLEERPQVKNDILYVRVENVERAVRIVARGAAYSVRAMGWLSRSKDAGEAERVVKALRRYGSLSLMGVMNAAYLSRVEAQRALELLADEDVVTHGLDGLRKVYFIKERE